MEVRPERLMYRAFSAEAGLTAPRQLALDRGDLDPIRHAHVRRLIVMQPDIEMFFIDIA